jgi:hypothetical protein
MDAKGSQASPQKFQRNKHIKSSVFAYIVFNSQKAECTVCHLRKHQGERNSAPVMAIYLILSGHKEYDIVAAQSIECKGKNSQSALS